MTKFQVVFSGETHNNELLGQRCAFVESLSFQNIGINQPTSKELQKYSATIERLNNAFVEVDVFLADELNKHNAPIYYPNHDSVKKALELGDNWLASRYHHEITKLKNKPSSVMRWRKLTAEEKNFPDTLKIINCLYKEHEYFRSIVNYVCTKFVTFIYSKDKKSLEKASPFESNLISCLHLDVEEVCAFSRTYILEECAATMVLRLQGYTNLFHIGKVNEAVDWVAKNEICNLSINDSDLINTINKNALKINTVSKYKPYEHTTKNSSIAPYSLFKPNLILRRNSVNDAAIFPYNNYVLPERSRVFNQ